MQCHAHALKRRLTTENKTADRITFGENKSVAQVLPLGIIVYYFIGSREPSFEVFYE